MEKIKISSLDNQTLFDLLLSEKSYILFVDESGVSKENISTLNEILRNREDFFLNMSSDKDENNKNSIMGNDLLIALPDIKNLIYHASLKFPLKSVDIFARLINLKSLHLYGDLAKDKKDENITKKDKDTKKDVKEEELKDKKENEDENKQLELTEDLFNLIDSMYDR